MKPRDDHKTEQVFAATLRLVHEKGLAGITMSEIAREAAIATGTLYIYFDNKEALINELFTHCRQSAVEIYFEGYSAEIPYKQGFKQVWYNLFRYRTDYFEKAVFMDQCYHSPFITESTREITRKLTQPLHQLVARGREQQMLKDLDNFILLTFIVGTINEFVKHSKYSGKRIPKASADALFELCWDGIKI